MTSASFNLKQKSGQRREQTTAAKQQVVFPPLPSGLWRTLSESGPSAKLPKGIDALWDKATGFFVRLKPRRRIYMQRAAKIHADDQYVDCTDEKLKEEVRRLREIFRFCRETDDDLDQAFALIAEASRRTLGMKHHVNQVACGIALTKGCVTEMATGEGKTLAATLPAIVYGWRGRGCHVMTTNDYLGERDATEMSPLYNFCGLSVDFITQEKEPEDRRKAYLADITYCTNKEANADFLRDQIAKGTQSGLAETLLTKLVDGASRGTGQLVMRGLEYVIVDEADSVLIDESCTPLIISGMGDNLQQIEAFKVALDVARQLEKNKHYRVNQEYRDIDLTNAGRAQIGEICEPMGGIWRGLRRREELVCQSLTAIELFLRDEHYVVEDGKVVIIDEATGRLMPERSWREGLHQAIEVKEGVEITPPKDTMARLSFQRFFRLYKKIAGMTGTGAEATVEFWQIYHTPVVQIPTNRPCIRKYKPDRIFLKRDDKWDAIVQDVINTHAEGRPVLIGTRSVADSELLSERLSDAGLEHAVLNAVRHKEEAEITKQAGGRGKITVATNMAGRGTDIKLGVGVPELGGLHVIETERQESERLDRQLFGRASRQGDPGSACAFTWVNDEMLKRYGGWRKVLLRYLMRTSGQRETSSWFAMHVIKHARKKAEKNALRQRKGVLKTDDWLDEFLGFAGRAV